jgi:hypothetical protein
MAVGVGFDGVPKHTDFGAALDEEVGVRLQVVLDPLEIEGEADGGGFTEGSVLLIAVLLYLFCFEDEHTFVFLCVVVEYP